MVTFKNDQHHIWQKLKGKKNAASCRTLSSTYLGHVADQQGIHPNPKKVDAILQAKTPKDQKELWAYLGLLNFYGKFISITCSLHCIACLFPTCTAVRDCFRKLMSVCGHTICRTYRFTAYKQFVWWVWGKLGRHRRVRLPCCVVGKIRERFPSMPNIGPGVVECETGSCGLGLQLLCSASGMHCTGAAYESREHRRPRPPCRWGRLPPTPGSS